MPVVVPSVDDVQRGFRRAILLPGRSEEGEPSPEYEETATVCEHFRYPWRPIGNGVEVLNWGSTHLVRVAFSHRIDHRGNLECARLAAALDALGATMRRAIPLSTSAQIRIEPCSSRPVPSGVEVECLARGIVNFSIPDDIVEFMVTRGFEVVAGKRAGCADDRLASPVQFGHRPFAYEFWHIEVRSLGKPRETCRVVIERPYSVPFGTTLPMLVTGLADDNDE